SWGASMRNSAFTAVSLACAAQLSTASLAIAGHVSKEEAGSHVRLLHEVRPIGGSGNNLDHPEFDAVPGSAELRLAPSNFAPGSTDGLIDGPNPRAVSNVIAGGTGAKGENEESEDAAASGWLYVFGQFLDHDLGLES